MKKQLLTLSFLTILLFLISTKLFSQPLSGTYTIGDNTENFDFKSIGEALVNLELYGVGGKTILELTDSYNVDNELAEIKIGQITGNNETNSIILTVSDNAKEVIFTRNGSHILEIGNTNWFEIQGKNKLFFQTSESINNQNAIYINNIIGDESINITIDGCTFIGVGNEKNHCGIYFTPSENNSYYNISISNNTFYKLSQAINAEGFLSYHISSSKLKIINNTIGDNRIDYNISQFGINLNCLENVTISENTIFSVFSNEMLAAGIKIIDCSFAQINNNKILDIVSYNNDGKACGILASTENKISEVWCYNNMISHVAAKEAYGISIEFDDQIMNTAHIYYNSVLLTIDNSYEYFGEIPSSCFNLNCEMSTTLVKNNIFQNDFGDNPSSVEERLGTAISFLSEHNPFSAISNNIFYTNNITNGYTAKNSLKYFNFEEWNDFNNNDTTSLNSDPDFISNYLLKIKEPNSAGSPIPQINVDYFGKHRNSSTPDIGAHEANDNSGINNFVSNYFDAYYCENTIFINSLEELNGDISIISLNGKSVFQTKVSGMNVKFDLNKTLSSGIYIIKYAEKNKCYSSKVLIH
ncbi:T9SS type A sorting domain-containing protein [Bacteroidales bacterium OttesenSCG-928-K03]|nr:T9SS type A sorting domain-containing protein [Odoribacter sp. OttesenSCG-928-L07]MDL2238795.1 T9SS type A sorting domain-containing protein [Bacteroidales bacterium OttesenSCG-928-L14]MDL2240788.1 T9SS type A sorting domain-containing protein [Bacteroidales bacterium OttesenSCG-928-K22]MDL2242174.1 T9SS type A sorting domain-containing protein [Bacteroidales bacterium OttesenSCG-928-K03]